MKLNDYKILYSKYRSDLEREVVEHLDSGYELVGGLVIVVTQKSMHYSSVEEYAQAVCRSLVPYKEDN